MSCSIGRIRSCTVVTIAELSCSLKKTTNPTTRMSRFRKNQRDFGVEGETDVQECLLSLLSPRRTSASHVEEREKTRLALDSLGYFNKARLG